MGWSVFRGILPLDAYLDDFLVVGCTGNDGYVAFVNSEVLCEDLAYGLVGGSLDGGGLDLDLVAPVWLGGDAFALAPGVNLDVDSHGLGENVACGGVDARTA